MKTKEKESRVDIVSPNKVILSPNKVNLKTS